MTVEAGAILGEVNAALAAQRSQLLHGPWSQPIASVGGAIATHGVGYLAARYGTMGEEVLGLKAVLASGALRDTKAISKTAGLSLQDLFIGAEATMGVVVEATLSVRPIPEQQVL